MYVGAGTEPLMAISDRTILAFSTIMAVISILAFGFVAFELLRDGDSGAQTPTFEEFHSGRLGFSIEIPEGWTHETVLDEADGETRTRERFWATIPYERGSPHVTVSKWPVGDLTVEKLLARDSSPLVHVQSDELVIAGHGAVRQRSTGREAGSTKILVFVDDTVWSLVLREEADDRDEYLLIFERVYNSFQPR
jgi:hypothetical protein